LLVTTAAVALRADHDEFHCLTDIVGFASVGSVIALDEKRAHSVPRLYLNRSFRLGQVEEPEASVVERMLRFQLFALHSRQSSTNLLDHFVDISSRPHVT